eukprot:10455879-Ditylum_brightwellii.AAC.1
MPKRGKCTDAGMTRLAFLRYNIERDCEELKARHGIEPMGPLAVDKTDGSGTKIRFPGSRWICLVLGRDSKFHSQAYVVVE